MVILTYAFKKASVIFMQHGSLYTLSGQKESQVPGQVKSAKVPGQLNMLSFSGPLGISPGTYSSLVDKE